MGIVEVLPKYRHLKRRIAETTQAVLEAEPDVLITIDSPDFCLRVARQVREQRQVRVVHYVAPSVWAWRPGRADKMAKVVDHVLALLPFEPPYMQAAGMECDFVGHPVAGEPEVSGDDITAFRAAHGLGQAPVITVLPGSRRGEVARLAPIFGAALTRFLAGHPDMRVVIPTVAGVHDLVCEQVAHWSMPVTVLPADLPPADKRAAMAVADIALAASGTVSLELAAAGTPMVIGYKANWLSWQLAKRLVKIDTATLVNLVSDTRTVPEALGEDCTPERIAEALEAVLRDPAAQMAAMETTMQALGRGQEDPGLRAARAVLRGLA